MYFIAHFGQYIQRYGDILSEKENLQLNNADTASNSSFDEIPNKKTFDASHEQVEEYVHPKKKKSRLFAFIFIIANVLAVALTIVMEYTKSGDVGITPPAEIFALWGKNIWFLVLAFACMIFYLLFDAFKYMLMFKTSIGKAKVKDSLKVAIIGRYYDYITPLGSGGQPFQVYYLAKHNIPAGVSAATPIASFFYSQLAFLLCSLTLFIVNPVNAEPGMHVIAYVGAFFAFIIPGLIVLASIFPNFTWKVVNLLITLVAKLRIIKKVEETRIKVRNNVMEYTQSLRIVNKNVFIIVLNLLLSCAMQFALCSAPYFVVRAFGLPADWLDIVTMTLFVYCSISFIPTPGNAGAAEFSFGMVFAGLSAVGIGSALFYGTLLWRVSTYYFAIFLGLAVVILNSARKRKLTPHLIHSMQSQVSDNKNSSDTQVNK